MENQSVLVTTVYSFLEKDTMIINCIYQITLYHNLRTLKCGKYVFGSWANSMYVYIFLIELKSYLLFSLHFFFLLSILQYYFYG